MVLLVATSTKVEDVHWSVVSSVFVWPSLERWSLVVTSFVFLEGGCFGEEVVTPYVLPCLPKAIDVQVLQSKTCIEGSHSKDFVLISQNLQHIIFCIPFSLMHDKSQFPCHEVNSIAWFLLS